MNDFPHIPTPKQPGEQSGYGDIFQTAFEFAVDGMFITEMDGLCILVNSRMNEMTGYSSKDLIGKVVYNILSPEDDTLQHCLTELINDATIITRECSFKRNDGTLLPVEIRARTTPGEKICATVRDISEQKKAEESLRTSEMRYRALVESQIDLVSRYRADTLLTFVNDAYCKFYGKSREELIGQSFMFMVAPEFRDIVKADTERMAQDPKSVSIGEYLNYTQEGKASWIQWIVHSIANENGEVLELQAVGRDITQLKQAEEALRQANIVVENSPAILFRWKVDEGWPVEYVSKNVTQLEYTVEELLDENLPFSRLIYPDDLVRVDQEVQDYAKEGIDRFQQEYRIRTKSGLIRWIDDRTVAERDETGRIRHYQGILIDITERKQAEEERILLQTQLHQAQKLESVGRLAGGVAHDFNNMLTAILGHTQIAMTNIIPSDPIYEDLKIVEECSIHSADIVRQLLAFARQQTVAPKVLDLNDTVTSMIKMLRRMIGEDIDFTWTPGRDLWPVKIDPSQIDQLLANLCVNARDAIAGVGTIAIESENATISQQYCTDHPGSLPGEYVMLAVHDNGCGMDTKTIDHIFEPFFTTKKIGMGTGLGLATVYGIVRQNEGFITVDSELGKGSHFKIFLPRSFEDPMRNHSIAAAIPSGHGEIILVVEDEGTIRDTTRAMLVKLGYRILVAETPAKALELAGNNSDTIALLLTDVIMPEMDGRALSDLIKTMHPEIKCLFTSGYPANVIAHRGILDENVYFLQKPFTMKDLAVKIRTALEIH